MTRRITLSVLLLVLVLLVLGVVPLGITMTRRGHDAFREETAARARTVASAAEERLSDRKPLTEAREAVEAAGARGDCAQAYDTALRLVVSTRCAAAADPAALARDALVRNETQTTTHDSRMTIALPFGDTAPSGVVVYSRSTDSLSDQELAIWGWLSVCAVAAFVASVAVSVRLARWVSRPLTELDAAAARLGEGELGARAEVGGGPPEVRRLAATFNTMAGRTEALVHGHAAVTADVSHQLRTPLTALRLRLDLLAADADPEAAQELAGAQGEIARLSRLVDGLLAVARAEGAIPRPVEVRLPDVIAERVAAWEPVANERQVALVVDCQPGLVAHIGEGDLEQVLDNLLANALDAVPAGGTVRIEAARDRTVRDRIARERNVRERNGRERPAREKNGRDRGGPVRLAVVDDGPGMSEQAREHAFRRFGNPDARGTGLGLAIVHRLVTANGGEAAVEPGPGGVGLAVRLTLR